MSKNQEITRWGVEQRLEFIEFRLFWEGGINRADIQNFFKVSTPQASNDLSKYQVLAPDNLRYDRSEKRYFATDSFKPIFMSLDANTYLSQLMISSDQGATNKQTWLSQTPSVDVLPVPHRQVDVATLRAIAAAVREKKSLEIFYQSMNPNRPKPMWRRITPHAFANDGSRWHVRAYCHISNSFKDFLLSRARGTRDPGSPGAKPETDIQWQTFVNVILSPNPRLADHQQQIIAQDYGMKNGHTEVSVRQALLYYFKKRYYFGSDEYTNSAQEAPVIIVNREILEIDPPL